MTAVTVSDALADARRRLVGGGIADAARETRLLVGGLLELEPAALISGGARVLTQAELELLETALVRRLAREPVYRILGSRPFFGLTLTLSPDTLEPRSDTEILVERLMPRARAIVADKGTCGVLDLGTGTGAICLALIDAVPGVVGTGTDISPGALETARANAQLNGLADRFDSVESDWFSAVDGTFDIIVSNPPYIRSDVVDGLADEVRQFDPRRALDGGDDGLTAYRAIARKAADHLAPAGIVGLEIGYDQKEPVAALMSGRGFRLLEAAPDLGGNDRVLIFANS
ncbi:peptide chain release factor N(5)-glutamine methyltransferase [Rhizobium sp. ARZ01]|uniref:peptide chain release factor N(5)-glutamine methyltransferase n=1 Tax=Rhizobium sp. ARZ01 TaxID=2769313 RepID=UPI00177BBF31|nr:peptide chain release factor N(5)-glutamine methyltransferase [Rhizobium sp. ARZ01]MBD9374974.1 peptide chain release factor N(5)-glutamine methyltransferase [Rhizobium sp. ARZ01]